MWAADRFLTHFSSCSTRVSIANAGTGPFVVKDSDKGEMKIKGQSVTDSRGTAN